jgi:hypothetical protein
MIPRLIFILFLLYAGLLCIPAIADESVIPDLVGSWTGSSEGYHSATGYFHEGAYQYLLNVAHQEGRIFNGTLMVSGMEPTRSYPFSGVVGTDMKSLFLAEYGTGIDLGHLISPDVMELVLLVNEKDNFSVLCTLRKNQS